MLMVKIQVLEEDSKIYVVDILSDDKEILSILRNVLERLRAKGVDVYPIYDYDNYKRGIRIQI